VLSLIRMLDRLFLRDSKELGRYSPVTLEIMYRGRQAYGVWIVLKNGRRIYKRLRR